MEAPKPESAENVDQSGVQVEHVDASGAEVSKPNTKDANQPPKTWREFAVANNGSGQGHEMHGYMAMKMRKLDEAFDRGAQRFAGLPNSNMFAGVCIYVNGYTKPGSDELRRIMQQYGGRYSVYYMKSKVTHVIATNLCKSKLLTMKSSDNVVHPDWIVDSLKSGRLLDFNKYRLPSYCGKPDGNARPSCNSSVADQSAVSNSSAKSISSVTPGEVKTNLSFSRTELQPSAGCNESVELNSSSFVVDPESISSANQSDGCVNAEIASHQAGAISDAKADEQASGARNASACNRQALDCRQPGFLSTFYSRSRLHFLSTWHFEMVDYVTAARRKASHVFTGKQRLVEETVAKYMQSSGTTGPNEKLAEPMESRDESVIFHIDIDCFFASVALRNRPDLVDEPVCVTHSKTGMGKTSSNASESRPDAGMSYAEIASCNYAARSFGVRNGMLVGEAMKRCRNLHFVEYDFEGYRTVSRAFYDLLLSYTFELEAVSCDEMYVDLTRLLNELDDELARRGHLASQQTRIVDPMFVANSIRQHVFETSRVHSSIGIGTNKLLARLATRRAKPNGAFRVRSCAARVFMRDVPVADLPGVGYSITERLRSQFGVTTCSDVIDARRVTPAQLQAAFGAKLGLQLAEKCAGECRSGEFAALRLQQERKSVSCDVNYGIRFTSRDDADRFLSELAEEVASRLRACSKRARKLTLRVLVRAPHAPKETLKFLGHGICDAQSRSVVLSSGSTNLATVIARESIGMFNSLSFDITDVRGIAIHASKLEDEHAGPAAPAGNQRTILDFVVESSSNDTLQAATSRQASSGCVDSVDLHASEKQKDSSEKLQSSIRLFRNYIRKPECDDTSKSTSVGISVEDAGLDFSFQTSKRSLKRPMTTLESFGIGVGGVAAARNERNEASSSRSRGEPAEKRSRRADPDCIVISSDSESEPPARTYRSHAIVLREHNVDVDSRDRWDTNDTNSCSVVGKPKSRSTRGRRRTTSTRSISNSDRPRSIMKRKSAGSNLKAIVLDEPSTSRKRSVHFEEASNDRPLSRALTTATSNASMSDESLSMSTSVTGATSAKVSGAANVESGFCFEPLRTAADELEVAQVFRSWVFNEPDAPIDLDSSIVLERCGAPRDVDIERFTRFLVSLIVTQQLDTLARCVRVFRYVVQSLMMAATATQCDKAHVWLEAQKLTEAVVQEEFGKRYRRASLSFD